MAIPTWPLRRGPRFGSIVPFILFFGGVASAHLGHPVAGAERRIELDLSDREPRLTYRVGLSADQLAKEFLNADRDHDGNVSSEESSRRIDQLTEELAGALRICTGGELATLACHNPKRESLVRASISGWQMEAQAAPFFEWVWVLPDDRARWLSIDDGWNRDGITRTDVKITADPARALLRAGPTANETGISLDFSFNDALLAGAPRTVVVERAPGPSSIRLYALGLALGLALVGGLWAFGRRGKTKP